MSDHNLMANPPVITRGEGKTPEDEPIVIQKTLTEGSFGKKHKNANTKFWYPQTDVNSFVGDIPFYSLSWLVTIVNKKARQDCADIFLDHFTDDNDNLLEVTPSEYQKYIDDLTDFTEGAAKLKDLLEECDELTGLQSTYIADSEFGQDTEKGNAIMVLIKDVANKLIPLRMQIKNIKDEYKIRAAKRETRKSSKTAVTA